LNNNYIKITKKKVGDYMKYVVGKLKQLAIPMIFLIIVINFPIVIFNYTGTRPDTPPPGWSSIRIYYLYGDYDYFFRLRIMPQTLPFWAILGIISIQVVGIPHRLQLKYDLLVNLVLGIILTISWMVLVHYIFIVNHTGDWEASSIPLTPIMALIAVPLHRTVTRRKMNTE
jgi:hypothetical protein